MRRLAPTFHLELQGAWSNKARLDRILELQSKSYRILFMSMIGIYVGHNTISMYQNEWEWNVVSLKFLTKYLHKNDTCKRNIQNIVF